MIRLNSSTEYLSITTGSTSKIAYVATYTTHSKGTELDQTANDVINTITETQIVSAEIPASYVEINYFSLVNNGIATNNITVNKLIGEVLLPLTPTIPLLAGESFVYTEAGGFVRYDVTGQIMTVGAPGEGVPSGGTANQVLAKIDGTDFNTAWITIAGTGDVVGPASAVDNAIARYDGTSGKIIQGSVVLIADTTGNMSGMQKITVGVAAGATGSIELKGVTSGTVTLKVADAAGTYTLTLPTNDGSSGEILSTDGSGVLSWIANSGISDGNKGDITVSSSGTVWDINNDAVVTAKILNANVTLAKMANVATATVFYRKTAGTGVPEVQTLATLKTDLGLTGTNSGDVTLAGTPDYITISGQVITRNKLDPADDLNTFASSVLLGLLTDETGTGVAVFNTAPTFATTITIGAAGGTTGSILLKGTTSGTVTIKTNDTAGTWTLELPANDGSAGQFLKTDGSGVTSWDTVPAISDGNKGDITVSSSGTVWEINADAVVTAKILDSNVTLAKIANIADQTILGNNSGGAAAPIALTASQTKTVLSLNNVENTALSTWAGTTNITTLGTIATGVWNGTVISPTYGGTGVNNSTRTLTIAANSGTISFTSSVTLTVAATASVSGTNTGDITLAGTPDYITISGQVITRNKLDPADDLNTFASSVLIGLLTDETGTGSAVFNTAPTFLTTVQVGTAGGATGSLLMTGTTSGVVTIKTADAAGTWTLTLPTTDGGSGEVLTTDGNGVTSWSAAGTGSVTSVDAANGVETVSGSAITATGTIRGSYIRNAQTGTTYTIVTGDRGKYLTLSNALGVAVTLPAAGGTFPDGWFSLVQNVGTGSVVITPVTSTINGAVTLTLTTNQSAIIVSDGTNYSAFIGQSSGGSGATVALDNLSGVAINAALVLGTSDAFALGSATKMWSDLFLADGALINFNNGNSVITHSSAVLTVSTGDLRVTTAGTNSASVVTVGGTQTLTAKTLTSPAINSGTIGTSLVPTSDDGAALGDTTHNFSDLFLASGAVINYANSNVVITHTSGILTMGTGDLRITTAGTNSASVVTVGGTQTLTAKTLTSPTLTTPSLGVATATSINKVTITAPATSATLTIADGGSLITSGAVAITLTGSGSRTISTYGTTDGLMDVTQLAIVQGDFTLSASGSAQNAFPTTCDVVTLEADTTYDFEGLYDITCGTTAHTLAMSFVAGGGFTIVAGGLSYQAWAFNGIANTTGTAQNTTWITQLASTVVTASSATAGNHVFFKGTIRVDAGGTLTPQITFSVNPTGTNVMKVGSKIQFIARGSKTFEKTANFA